MGGLDRRSRRPLSRCMAQGTQGVAGRGLARGGRRSTMASSHGGVGGSWGAGSG
jgi:hypothetical protein